MWVFILFSTIISSQGFAQGPRGSWVNISGEWLGCETRNFFTEQGRRLQVSYPIHYAFFTAEAMFEGNSRELSTYDGTSPQLEIYGRVGGGGYDRPTQVSFEKDSAWRDLKGYVQMHTKYYVGFISSNYRELTGRWRRRDFGRQSEYGDYFLIKDARSIDCAER